MVEDDEVKILRPERVCSVCFFTLKRFVADAFRPSALSEEPLIVRLRWKRLCAPPWAGPLGSHPNAGR